MKKGDKVVCVDSRGTSFVCGKVYEVSEVARGDAEEFVSLLGENVPGRTDFWDAKRFRMETL